MRTSADGEEEEEARHHRRHHRHHHHPGILSRWSWRRALLFSGGIGLEPRLRFALPYRSHNETFTAP